MTSAPPTGTGDSGDARAADADQDTVAGAAGATAGAGSSRPARGTHAGDPASAVYGTILAAVLFATRSHLGTGQTLLDLAVTLAAFWLAHAYTDVLGGRTTGMAQPGAAAWWHALRTEWPIVESGVPPAVALLVVAALRGSGNAGTLAALLVCTAQLLGWAALAARRMGLRPRQAVPYTVATGLLGLVVIALKAAIH